MPRSKQPNEVTLKAGALMCPVCCVELLEFEDDFEHNGVILRNIKLLRCPLCQEESFTPEQQKVLENRIINQNAPRYKK